jgi:hypothetical protein
MPETVKDILNQCLTRPKNRVGVGVSNPKEKCSVSRFAQFDDPAAFRN